MSQSAPASGTAAQSGRKQPSVFQRIALALSPRGGPPQWDPRLKRLQTQWRIYALLLFILVITLLVISWALYQPIEAATPRTLPQGADLAVILGPVLAAAAGIERFLETIFGVVEGYARTVVAYLGRGMRWLHNAESEVDNARQWLATVAAEYTRQLESLPNFAAASIAGQDPKKICTEAQNKLGAAKDLMTLAEQRLTSAEKQLADVVNSDGYRNAKRAGSIYLGLLLGLLVATASSLQMFAMMGVKVGSARVDVIITGLVIGSGAAPVHSLINILQSAKDTLDGAQGWLKTAQKSKPASQEGTG